MDEGSRRDARHLLLTRTPQEHRRPAPRMAGIRTARDLWVPAVNAHGGFGRWRFVEVKDPYDCRQDLLSALTFESLLAV